MIRRVGLFVVALALLSGCAKSEAQVAEEMVQAETELVLYFASLATGDFDTAADMMADNPEFWEMAQDNNPDIVPEDHGALLAAVCARQSLCLPVYDVVKAEPVENNLYSFTVKFALGDEVFVLGPCCGASQDEMPPVSEFTYQVHRVNDGYKVEAEPLYVP